MTRKQAAILLLILTISISGGYYFMHWLPTKYKELEAKYAPYFRTAESKYNLPIGLLSAVAYQESRFNATAKSPVGALGLMQFMPATAKGYGIDPLDPIQAIDGAGRLLRDNYAQFKSWPLALAAYNWGSGNVSRNKDNTEKWPLETRDYVKSIVAKINIGDKYYQNLIA